MKPKNIAAREKDTREKQVSRTVSVSLCKWRSCWLVQSAISMWPNAFIKSRYCHKEAALVDCRLLVFHNKPPSVHMWKRSECLRLRAVTIIITGFQL